MRCSLPRILRRLLAAVLHRHARWLDQELVVLRNMQRDIPPRIEERIALYEGRAQRARATAERLTFSQP